MLHPCEVCTTSVASRKRPRDAQKRSARICADHRCGEGQLCSQMPGYGVQPETATCSAASMSGATVPAAGAALRRRVGRRQQWDVPWSREAMNPHGTRGKRSLRLGHNSFVVGEQQHLDVIR